MLPMYQNNVNTALRRNMTADYESHCCSYETFNFLSVVANW
jgi:hypothetical protein